MLPIWVPEVTFGNALCITLIAFVYLNLRASVRKNLDLMKRNNDLVTIAAGHAKMSFDTSTHNGVIIRTAVAETKVEIKAAVDSLTAAAIDHTPMGTMLPAELRVTIAKEIDAPDAVAK